MRAILLLIFLAWSSLWFGPSNRMDEHNRPQYLKHSRQNTVASSEVESPRH